MGKSENIAKIVRKRIEEKGPGSVWTPSDFKGLSMSAITKTLGRLTKKGVLTRIRKGIYYYPKTTVLGPTTSNPITLAMVSFPSTYFGATTAAYNLGLTTQIPATPILYGNVSYGKSDFLGVKIRFRKRNIAHLRNLKEMEINILETLRNINKISFVSPKEIIIHLKKLLPSSSQLPDLLKASLSEPPRVRALLGSILEELNLENKNIKKLHESLNPLTNYNLGIKDVLKHSNKWRIR